MTTSNVVCPACKKVYVGHSNHYGKVCLGCGSYIPPIKKSGFVRNNEAKLAWARDQVRDVIRGTIKKKDD